MIAVFFFEDTLDNLREVVSMLPLKASDTRHLTDGMGEKP